VKLHVEVDDRIASMQSFRRVRYIVRDQRYSSFLVHLTFPRRNDLDQLSKAERLATSPQCH
jgi:hypothetical protein